MSNKNEVPINAKIAEKKGELEIAKTWLTGRYSVTMIIERKIAEEYGLADPQYVVLERRKEGILIRKLDL